MKNVLGVPLIIMHCRRVPKIKFILTYRVISTNNYSQRFNRFFLTHSMLLYSNYGLSANKQQFKENNNSLRFKGSRISILYLKTEGQKIYLSIFYFSISTVDKEKNTFNWLKIYTQHFGLRLNTSIPAKKEISRGVTTQYK